MKNKLSSNIPNPKRVESRYTDSNSLLSAIIESPRDIVIFALDRNYCYTAFNKSHKQTIKNIWGADIEIGTNMLEIIKSPKDRKKAKKNFDRALKGESFTLVEECGEPSHRFYYEDAYSPVFDDTGQVTGLSLFLTDITEKKRTDDELDKYRNQLEDIVKQRTRALEKAKEKLEFDIHERTYAKSALRESEAKYKEIATSIPGVVYQFTVKKDGSYSFPYIDESCEKFFQHKAKAVVADPNLIFNMVPPDELQSFFDSIEKSAKTLKEWQHDFRVVLPNGQEHWFEGRSIPHILPSGEPFWNGVVTDVTERKQAEKDLKSTRDRLSTLIDSMEDGITTINNEYIITDINPAAIRMSGYSKEEMLGQPCYKINHCKDDSCSFPEICTVKEIFKNGNPITVEHIHYTKEGNEYPVEIVATPIFDDEGNVKHILEITRDITERKRKEEALQESEEKYRGIFDESVATVYLFDAQKNFIDSNQAGLDLLGYSRDELLKMSIPQVDADPETELLAHKQLLAGDRIVNYEHKLKRKDGSIITVLNNSRPIININGNVIGIQSTLIDVTERKQAEHAFRESEERYRSILENIEEGYYEVDLNGNFIFFNDSICRMLNYSRDELMGMNNRQYMDSESADRVYQAFNEVFRTEKSSTTIDFKIKRKEGNINAGEISISLLKDRNNQSIGFRGIVRDITNRKLAEQALRESEEKFRGVIEQSNDGIYVLQGDRFVFINPRFTEITGFELDEISAEDFDFKKLVAKEGLKILEEREAKHKRGEDLPSRYIFKGLRKDRQKMDLEVSVTTVEWQGKTATLGVLRDVTERIKTRTKLEEALEDAKQANSVKSLFMANMSHEIRTPLNAILGFTDLIETSTRHLVSEEEQEFFDTVRDSGNRLMDTVHEILDISQIEAGTYDLKLEHLDLVILVRNMIRECQSMADKKDLKIKYSSEIDSAFIKADQYSMSQAICNIIDNAIKYTKQGKINISIEQKAKQYVLSIQDTGIGIGEEYLEDLYNAFSQESEGYTKKYQGIGLGMAITKRHLDMNQVDMDVKSTRGVGTTFLLTFKPVKKKPLHKRKQIKQKEVKDKPTAEAIDKSLILLVEDDTSSQKLTEFFLKEKYDLCFAVFVGEAKQQLKKYRVDLVLLDLSLVGNEDGLDLVRWMRKSKTWKTTPVIATTAHAFTTDQNNCITAGCNDYLPKPIKKEKLLEKINAYV